MRTINTIGGTSYSTVEIRDLGISVLVLSVAFAIALSRRNSEDLLILILASAMVISTSFIAHELAHKFVAQRFGAKAEYRMFPAGLFFALMVSFLGFMIAAPGAVHINGKLDRSMLGKIAAAGPAANIFVGAAALALTFLTDGFISSIFWMMANMNAFFALLNMLPIIPFDGSKVRKWDLPMYFIMLSAACILLAAVWHL